MRWRMTLATTVVVLATLPAASKTRAEDPPPITISIEGLPERSLPEALPDRAIPSWLRTHWRIGHLPPGLGRMPEEYVKGGYQVITINALRKWDIVGPTAGLYPAEEVKQADLWLRTGPSAHLRRPHPGGPPGVLRRPGDPAARPVRRGPRSCRPAVSGLA